MYESFNANEKLFWMMKSKLGEKLEARKNDQNGRVVISIQEVTERRNEYFEELLNVRG